MITGTAVTIAWKLWLKAPTGIYELIPAFFCSALAVVVVSLLSKAPQESEG
jgi:Na+/proline symporter